MKNEKIEMILENELCVLQNNELELIVGGDQSNYSGMSPAGSGVPGGGGYGGCSVGG